MSNRVVPTRDPTLPLPPRTGLATVLGWRVFVALTCGFWAYATLSAVLYAYGLGSSIEADLGESPFATGAARIVQYLALLPLLLAAYWRSLQMGWQPRQRIVWQLLLAIAFAVVAYPLLGIGVIITGESVEKEPEHWTLAWYLAQGTLTTWLASFTDFLVRYGFGLTLVTGVAVYKQLRDSELQRAELERQWHGARLAALRMQLSPHTLFNLLHLIRGQIAWDPAGAQALVLRLADLLRRLLRAGEQEFVPLADELAFVGLYLDLQTARFGDRLTCRLADAGALRDLRVPSLILQPLVENAIVHGLAGHAGPVTVAVEVTAGTDELVLEVSNTLAPGTRQAPLEEAGHVGLRNVRERLAVQFGARAALSAGPAGTDRWCATVRLPRLPVAPGAGAGS